MGAADISYTDILKQIKRFFFDTQNSSNLVPKNIPKGQLTHAIIENSDGRQQTLIGFATAHHANTAIYIPKIQSLSDTTDCLENETIKKPLATRNIVDCEEYKIGEPPEPSFVKEYKDVHRDSIDQSLLINCAMSAAAAFSSKEGAPHYPLIGSLAVFNTKISDVATYKSETTFLPVETQPLKRLCMQNII